VQADEWRWPESNVLPVLPMGKRSGSSQERHVEPAVQHAGNWSWAKTFWLFKKAVCANKLREKSDQAFLEFIKGSTLIIIAPRSTLVVGETVLLDGVAHFCPNYGHLSDEIWRNWTWQMQRAECRFSLR
jgi:hypothetical protein